MSPRRTGVRRCHARTAVGGRARGACALQPAKGMGTQTNRAQLSPEQHRAKLLALLRGAPAVMLLTRGAGERIAGRPMALARVDDDATIYLTTSIDSNKAVEIERDPRVTVSVQDSGGFVVIDGEARITRDRALIDALWQDSWKAWFPEGKAEADIAIVVISPLEGTYWTQSFGHGLSYLYRMAKARVTGEPPELQEKEIGSVDLRPRP